MKKILSLFTALCLIVCLSSSVVAGVVSSGSGNTISIAVQATTTSATVTGQVSDSSITAVAIALYDEAGTTLIRMQTAAVGSDDSFSSTFDGLTLTTTDNYLVKVANYGGGAWSTAVFEVDPVPTPIPSTTPTAVPTATPSESIKSDSATPTPTAVVSGTGRTGETGTPILLISVSVLAVGFALLFFIGRRSKNEKKASVEVQDDNFDESIEE
ncbi:MAG: hypothetical protein WCX26_06795 [Saccharofermentanales bacterium]